jgi:peptidyl-prolyl cis-trans isomerase B (cyclophilin B)
MAVCASRWGRALARLGVVSLVAGGFLVGCTPPESNRKPPPKPKPAPPAVFQAPAKVLGAPIDPRLHQSFKDAVLLEPPDGQQRPPDLTRAGKAVGKLYTEVVKNQWDKVRFQTDDGKSLSYTATVQTELGPIRIELRPDLAPNHVRNFVALARAGYYDGLAFDRTVRESSDDQSVVLELIEAGCPLGTGEAGYGSIGYWMKPEVSATVRHVQGTVGAWHGEEVESAACKFYITLSDAAPLDGNWTIFGRVTQGLDVARTIRVRPVREDEPDCPQQPVAIRSVTIQCTAEATAAGAP